MSTPMVYHGEHGKGTQVQRRPESDAEPMSTPMIDHGDHVRVAQTQKRPAVSDTEQMSTPMVDHGGGPSDFSGCFQIFFLFSWRWSHFLILMS